MLRGCSGSSAVDWLFETGQSDLRIPRLSLLIGVQSGPEVAIGTKKYRQGTEACGDWAIVSE